MLASQFDTSIYDDLSDDCIQAGVDEAGRGPLMGPVYIGAVIWHPDDKHPLIKDSKLLKSHHKIMEAYDTVKEYAISSTVISRSHTDIDNNGILNSTISGMWEALDSLYITPQLALIDGNYFRHPGIVYPKLEQIQYTTVTQGDNNYHAIAAASILAKVSRDQYITNLVDKYPELDDRYGILSNKGYGSLSHRKGMEEYGISQFHRTSFKICGKCNLNPV